MPESYSIHTCKLCGKDFEVKGHASACEKLHMLRGLKVAEVVRAADLDRLFLPGDRYPAALEIWCDESQKKATYIRVPEGKRALVNPKRPRGGPEIIHKR